MAITRCVCPRCAAPLTGTGAIPAQIQCPRCGTRFNPQAAPVITAVPAPTRGSGLPLLLGAIGAGLLFVLVAAGVVVAVCFLPRGVPEPTEEAKATEPKPRVIEGPAAGQPVSLPEAEKPWDANLTEEQKAKVQQSIDKGVTYLKKQLGTQKNIRLGAAALGGLTLLACGVSGDDPALRKVIERVRTDGPKQTATYDLALCILCLDRLGDSQDQERIRTMAARLMGGQQPDGWGYQCQALSSGDEPRLLALLAEMQASGGRTGAGGGADRTPPKPPDGKTTPPKGKKGPEPADLRSLPVVQPSGSKSAKRGGTDNSNTQFALLALWVAQKHGVPVDRSLAMVDAHFRTSQNANGSWGYHAGGALRPDSMTCAGLLGLAVGKGLVRGEDVKKAAGQKDPAIEKGMKFLAQSVGRTDPKPRVRGGKVIGAASLGDLYYLWSVERVAVIYDLRTIQGKDWYAWGANHLVASQNAEGGWAEAHPGIPDTCFALLFLKKTNVAQDLTAQIRTLNLLQHIEKPEK